MIFSFVGSRENNFVNRKIQSIQSGFYTIPNDNYHIYLMINFQASFLKIFCIAKFSLDKPLADG